MRNNILSYDQPGHTCRVKRMVMEAALMSTLFYGCESWLTNNFRPVKSMYFSAIKTLLGVRKTTTNDLCLVELGVPSVKGFVQNMQFRYFSRTLDARRNTVSYTHLTLPTKA